MRYKLAQTDTTDKAEQEQISKRETEKETRNVFQVRSLDHWTLGHWTKLGHWKAECRSKRTSYKSEKGMEICNKQTSIENKREKKGEALINLQKAALTTGEDTEEPWIMDSGATAHVTSKKNWLESYSEYSTPVKFKIGDGSYSLP